MFTIRKSFLFEAAHCLPHLPLGHQCSRPHGHSYRVDLLLEAETLDTRGFVVDYGELSDFRHWLALTVDHRDLNQVAPCPTTAEELARWFYTCAVAMHPQVKACRVYETASSYAEYRP